MGEPKAQLLVEGRPQALRIAEAISGRGWPVTVLGREPIEGFKFWADKSEFQGPLFALSSFVPGSDFVFVTSCDLPIFDDRIVDVLLELIGEKDAAVPHVCGFRQPFCALYRAGSFAKLPEVLKQEKVCGMSWIDVLDCRIVEESEFVLRGVNPLSTQGANTKDELQQLLQEAGK